MDLRRTFDEDAACYHRYRPGYVPELHAAVLAYCSGTGRQALEIGIGTGQATEPFLAAGWQVDAVELGPSLAAFAAARFDSWPSFRIIEGDFCALDLPADCYDLLYAGTAFHWLDQDLALDLVFRLLKPGGTIALFWNHPNPNQPGDPSNEANRRVYEKYRPQDKKPGPLDPEKIPSLLLAHGFCDIQTQLFRRVRILSAADYIGLLNTYSDHRALPRELKNAFERDMLDALRAVGGAIRIYDTQDLYLARKPTGC